MKTLKLKAGLTEEQGHAIIEAFRAKIEAEKGEPFSELVIIMAQLKETIQSPAGMINSMFGDGFKDVAMNAISFSIKHLKFDTKELMAAADKFHADVRKELSDDPQG